MDLSFDGSDDYVQLSNNSALNPTSSITVEAWIKPTGFGANSYSNSIFCKHGWASGNAGYVLRCGDNGKVSFNIATTNGSWSEAITGSILSTNTWYHVAGVFDGDSIKVYVNGTLEASTLYSGSMNPSSTLAPRIGDLAYGGGRLYQGEIDEIRVWGTDLSKAVLRDWMCRKVSKKHPAFSSLAGYWKMDETSGNSLNDYSGNSNTGTLVNGPSRDVSGVVLGDSSAYVYGTKSLALKTRFGDVFSIRNITGSPGTFHLVLSYDTSEQGTANNVFGKIDSTHFFSVFSENPSSQFDLSYHFKDLNTITNSQKCGMDLFGKKIGFSGNWRYLPSNLNIGGDSLVVLKQTPSEFVMALYETDSSKIISTSNGKPWYCGSDSLQLSAAGNDSFTYVWYKDSKILTGKTGKYIWVSQTGKYKVEMLRKGTSCKFNSTEINISNRTKPGVSLSALKGVCEDADTIFLSGGSPAGGVYTGTGVESGKYFFPLKTKAGKYTITYTYTDTFNCSSSDDQILEIYALPVFSKSGPLEYCNHLDSIPLNLLKPVGGTYTGGYIYNNKLLVKSAKGKTGYYKFKYEFTNSNQCYNYLNDSFKLKQSTTCFIDPIPNFCLKDAKVNLSAFPSGGNFIGNGVSSKTFDPQLAGVGTHMITYFYTNSENCTTSDTQLVKVFSNTNVSWNFSISACENSDSIAMQEGTPKGGTFEGAFVTSNGYFHPKKAGSGTHQISYKFVDANGCSNKVSSTAVLGDTTALTVKGLNLFCPNSSSVNLSNVSPAGGSYSGPGVASNVFDPRQVSIGKYELTYTYDNSSNCTSKAIFEVEVVKTDSVSVDITTYSCIYDPPVKVKIYPFGGVISGNGINGDFFYPSFVGQGWHQIFYTLTESHGCEVKDSVKVYVSDVLKASVTTIPNVCENDPEFKLVQGSPADSGTYFVNGVKADLFNPSVMGKGNYKVEYKTINFIGCRDSAKTSFIVNQTPAKPSITRNHNTLSSNYTKGNQWYDDNGLITGEVNKDFKVPRNGKYFLKVTSDSNCYVYSDTLDITLLGIVHSDKTNLKIFPNPVHGESFKILGLKPGSVLTIYDFTGNELQSTRVWKSDAEIFLNEYSSKLFLLKISVDLDHQYFKIQKE